MTRHLLRDDAPVPPISPADRGDPRRRPYDEAWDRSRADAAAVLTAFLPGLGLETAAQRADGGTLRISQRDADTPWVDAHAVLERILTRADLGDGRIKIVKDSTPLPEDAVVQRLRPASTTGRIPSGLLATALEGGHTVVLDGIDRRDMTIRRFNEHVSRLFACPVNTNAYVSFRPHRSFGLHWDNHEVIIVQLLGSKSWDVHAPVALSPHHAIHDPHQGGERVWSGVLGPGQFMYVPRGWAHDVTGRDELTFHLTVTIPRASFSKLLLRSLERAEHDPRGYRLAGDDAMMTSLIDDLATIDGLAAAYDDSRLAVAESTSQRASSLLAVLEGRRPEQTTWIRCPHPGGVVPVATPGGRQRLLFSRRALQAGDEAVDALGPLTDGRVRRLDEIVTGGRSPERLRAIVLQALEHGLFEVVDDPHEWGRCTDPA